MNGTTCGLGKLATLSELHRNQGTGHVLRFAVRWLTLPVWRRLPWVGSQRFVYAGRQYPYFIARYRVTWLNERAVELPIALAELRAQPASGVLEIGNVLGHYVSAAHRVVDKYESSPGVENIDVLEVSTATRYPLILSVSTLEHVGWDERPRDPHKAAAAIEHLKRCLAPGGKLFLTIPLGYNPPLEEQLADNRLGLTGIDCLVRVGDLEWRQVPWGSQGPRPYGTPFPCANAVVIGIYEAPAT